MSGKDEDVAVPFIRRKQKNLAYFQKYRPEIFEFFANFEPQHCELSITPGRDDVDLVDSGTSVYRHLAREYSLAEVSDFLEKTPTEKPIVTVAPPFFLEAGEGARFASRFVRESLRKSRINPSTFKGYYRGDILPSVVFLGCGLGYHIDSLTARADVIDVVVFEPDPERFALTLFTVDWEEICARFRGKGRSISFCIATNPSEENVRRVLGAKVAEIVPLYPYFSSYYNHLVNVDLYRIAKDLEKDLPVVGANWGNYDFELRGFRNVFHNLKLGGTYAKAYELPESHTPVAVVGSGPSLDARIGELKANRDKLVVMSAGTGLRALLSHGIRPDLHVELDADYMIYEMLSDIDEQFGLHDITLLCTVSVNPLVPPLFDKYRFYFSNEYYVPAFLGLNEDAIPGCSPTCTNAAMALAFAFGFRNLFLFGTDYGYQEKSQHHSRFSIYGQESRTEFASRFRKETARGTEARPKFETEGVNGTTVTTQGDYFTAKRAVENYLSDRIEQRLSFSVRNCSDGALIGGADWMSPTAFTESLERASVDERDRLIETLEASARDMPDYDTAQIFGAVAQEVSGTATEFLSVLRNSRLRGRKDLIIVCNQIRDYLNRVGPGSGRRSSPVVQLMGWQILKGTVQRFLQTGLCHGLAHEDRDLQSFLDHWKTTFLAFLRQLPDHFSSVILKEVRPIDDPWVTTRLMNPEPERGDVGC
ncbi:6-hydroxymethylpterin diphosphokinase MptE-like protein [Marinobacter sediminum]|uniref:motility associated factor glycosyltransferase family protein n=1 Tax=Marinobacter sediminum TaxID=256323 RepID=UPI00193ABB49|nr:6-hydroxymethylpterin diphosphokinase MptE-like protein [Marinobacter sediminum]